MRAFGSPSSLPGATITQFDVGFGSPSVDYYDSVGLTTTENGTGFGHPILGAMAEGTNNPPGFLFIPVQVLTTASIAAALQDENFQGLLDGRFGDMGGDLVILYSPGGGWPIRGPYDIRLIDAGGNVWPEEQLPGCYSALAGFGDDCETNLTREFLFFTLPKVPQGQYGIRVTWDGYSSIFLAEQLLVIGQDQPAESTWLIQAFPVRET